MTDRTFIDSCVRAINDYRAIHQVSPVTHNAVISTVSQSWADKMARTGKLGHNPNATHNGQPLGENCAYKWSSDRRDFTGNEVAEQWYSEVKSYDFGRHSGANTGHFTQLVWQSSREVGIGRAQSRDGKWFVVANFYPAGNYIGRNAENVFPPRGGKSALPTVAKSDQKQPAGQWPMSSLVKPLRADSDRADQSPSFTRYSPVGSQTSGTVIERRQETRTVDGVTKTIVTETRKDSDGRIKTTTTEKVEQARGGGTPEMSGRFGQLSVNSSPGPGASSTHRTGSGLLGLRTSSPRLLGDVVVKEKTGSEEKPQQNDRDFVDDVVRQHNVYRRQHGNVGDLALNRELCKMAERWAKQLASMRSLQHSSNSYRGQPVGENVAYKYSSAKEGYTGDEVVKQWYSEVSKVNFRQTESAVNSAGHFTQVVWKDSREIGVGRAFADNGERVYVVCNYFPPGNVIGRFKENVLPAR